MAKPMGDPSLAGHRTSALRGAFLGLVRNTALGPVERQVLATNTIEQQPLSDVERDIATSVLRPMLSTKYPNAPAGEIHAAAIETADKLTKRDLQTLVRAIQLKTNLQAVDVNAGRVRNALQGKGLDDLQKLGNQYLDRLNQIRQAKNPPGGFMAVPEPAELAKLDDEEAQTLDAYQDVVQQIRRLTGVKATPGGAPGQPGAPRRTSAADLLTPGQ